MIPSLIDVIRYIPIDKIYLILETARHRRIRRTIRQCGKRVLSVLEFLSSKALIPYQSPMMYHSDLTLALWGLIAAR